MIDCLLYTRCKYLSAYYRIELNITGHFIHKMNTLDCSLYVRSANYTLDVDIKEYSAYYTWEYFLEYVSYVVSKL